MFARGFFIQQSFIIFIFVIGLCQNNFAEEKYQSISLYSDYQRTFQGSSFIVTAYYNVSNGDNTLTGIGIRIHYDSSRLHFDRFQNLFDHQLMGGPDIVDETEETTDNDPDTDKCILFPWLDYNGKWPDQNLPLNIVDLHFTVNKNAITGETHFNVTKTTGTFGYDFQKSDIVIQIEKIGLRHVIQILKDLSRI